MYILFDYCFMMDEAVLHLMIWLSGGLLPQYILLLSFGEIVKSSVDKIRNQKNLFIQLPESTRLQFQLSLRVVY